MTMSQVSLSLYYRRKIGTYSRHVNPQSHSTGKWRTRIQARICMTLKPTLRPHSWVDQSQGGDMAKPEPTSDPESGPEIPVDV